MAKRIVEISDLHVGSIFGLLPPGFTTAAGAEAQLNAGQLYLYACWLDFCKWVGQVDALVILGDGIDGCQKAQRKMEACLVSIRDQIEALQLVCEVLIKASKPTRIYVVQGTEYHDLQSGEGMESFAEAIGATSYRGAGTGKKSHEVLDLEVEGTVINHLHGISVAQGLYRLTPHDREGIFSALAGKESKVPKADVVVRAHCHYYGHAEHASKHIVTLPCWQLPTRFMRRRSAYRMLPDIGGLVIEVDASKKPDDPVTLKKRLYDLPKIGVTHL